MPKVTKIHVYESEPTSFKFLQTLVERGAPDEDEGDVHSTLLQPGETATQKILGRIFSVPSDSVRAVLFLDDADLKERYLTANGEKKIVKAMSDAQIDAIFENADFQIADSRQEKAVFEVCKPGNFDLDEVTKAPSDRAYAVILNIPKSIAQHFSTNEPADINEARQILEKAIGHQFYVATLNAAAIKKSGVGSLKDRDQREELFDIKKFISSYPVRTIIDAARVEQDKRDAARKLTPGEVKDSGATTAEPAAHHSPAALSTKEKSIVTAVADAARRIYYQADAKDHWPTTKADKRELRQKLVTALTKAEQLGGDTKLIPAVVKSFYNNTVKTSTHYQELLDLLSTDAEFNKLVGDDAPHETSDEPEAKEPEAKEPEAKTADVSTASSPEEVASEIKKKGDDFADEVLKILSRDKKTAALFKPKK